MKKTIFSLLICTIILLGAITVYAAESHLLQVNAEGYGQIVVVNEGEEVVFDDNYPIQSATKNAEVGTIFKLGAKARDGYRFVNWTINGEEYSTEEIVDITVTSDINIKAVFEFDDLEGKEPVLLDMNPEDDTLTDAIVLTDAEVEGTISSVEDQAAEATAQNEKSKTNVALYIGVGLVFIGIAVGAVVVLKKR